ncbi:hypothetical protein BDK89_2427 [Ilumatobacter fluminis]|uniref:PH (Pleckstrin Homology) domain-containing protein n=1 Tax=Ilumatobacter fluminis TaxID=467091 RepID=A0A4R7I1S8_9ACTN|nr:hypothetical protein [Ilumatobacter fluminis]TDT16829.1 hypothetical protein BDK89_2427 [Ilumatobacter fluminis]
MESMSVNQHEVVIELSRFEKVMGFLGDLHIPRSAIESVTVVDDPHGELSGFRAPGLSVPGHTKIGTWRGKGKRIVAVIRKEQRALVIDTPELDTTRFIVTADDPDALAAALVP